MDRRSDLFSLGSVLYAMATGLAAFRGESSVEVIRRVSDGEPAPVRTLNPEAPDWLAEIIERLHAKDAGGPVPVGRRGGRPARTPPGPAPGPVAAAGRTPMASPAVPPRRDRPRPGAAGRRGAARDPVAAAGGGRRLRGLDPVGPAGPARRDRPAPRLSDRLKAAWEYRCDFRDGRYDYRWLHLEPNGPLASLAKPDRRGLRIAIPPRTDCRGVGAFTLFGVHGDFEVTASFEILRADRPREGDGVGPELYLRAVDGWDHYASMARMLRADHAEPQLRVAWGEKGDGRPRSPGARDRTDLKAGRFRIARAGSTVHYLVAPKDSDAFREVRARTSSAPATSTPSG